MQAMGRYFHYDMRELFKKCGYIADGIFDPSIAMTSDVNVTANNSNDFESVDSYDEEHLNE
jgi:hypothetical protein